MGVVEPPVEHTDQHALPVEGLGQVDAGVDAVDAGADAGPLEVGHRLGCQLHAVHWQPVEEVKVIGVDPE